MGGGGQMGYQTNRLLTKNTVCLFYTLHENSAVVSNTSIFVEPYATII